MNQILNARRPALNNTPSLADRILAHGKNIVYHFLGYLQFFVALTIAAAIIITLLSIPQQLGVLSLDKASLACKGLNKALSFKLFICA